MSDHDAPRADTGDALCEWCGEKAAVLAGECLDCAAIPGHAPTVTILAWEYEQLAASREHTRELAAALDDLLDTCDIQMRADGGLIVMRNSMERARELLAAAVSEE